MDNQNLTKNINNLTRLLGADRLLSPEDVTAILTGIMQILAEYKKGTEGINEETKQVVNTLLEQVIEVNKQALEGSKSIVDERSNELEALLKDVKQMIDDVEVLASNVKDGKDADEEKIVEDVISRIKIDPTVITVSAEEIRDKLSSLKDEDRLDKSAIKGLEKILMQKDLDYAIATLQQQTSFLINKGGLKNVTAGTNVTIDYTDPSNPVINSTGGGSGSPGGSTTQLQYNNAGSFGGISGATTDGTAVTYSAGNLIAADVTASGSGGLLLQANNGTDVALLGAGGSSGATFYGGVNIAGALTVDTNTLYVDATNNRAGIGTTSPASLLHVYEDTSSTSTTTGITVENDGTGDAVVQYLLTGAQRWYTGIDNSQSDTFQINDGSLSATPALSITPSTKYVGLGTSAPTHTLTQASSGTGVALYNTADQTTNYERVRQYWSSNVYTVASEKGGTGVGRTIGVTGTYTASSGVENNFRVAPTINQSSTAGYTALLVNPTETATGSGTKLLADFQVGGTSKVNITNVGNLGIGTTPTAYLHLKAGTATASTAPLKFTAGTVNTTPEAGTMEFSNSETGLTFTAVSTRRQVVLDTATQTLTDKFVTPQLQSVADAGGTLTPVSITNDMVIATALSQATTIAAPSGSPVQGEKLVIRLKDNGTARALTWNSIYRAIGVTLPTTTVISKTVYCGFIYNSTDTKWDCVAVAQEA